MPAGFDFPHRTDVWLPVVPILANAGDGRVQSPLERVGVLFVVGRLREGVTPTLASEELNRLARQLQQTGGAHRFGTDVVVTAFLDYLIGPVRHGLWALLAAVGVLLLIGCANVSGLMLTRVTTMDGIVSRAVAPWRFSVWMFTLFAVLAFVLATVGLVSLVSLDVAQRRHEFAVRLAVGAQRRDVRRSVLVSALWRVVHGVAFGVLAAVIGNRLIRHILFGVEPVDLTTYIAVIMLVLVVVTAASWLPAHRAAGTDPLALLRQEQ